MGRILGELIAAGAAVMVLWFIFQLVKSWIEKATREERDYK